MKIVVRTHRREESKEGSEEQVLSFEKEHITFGRAKTNDLVLNSPDISSKHGLISLLTNPSGSTISITDLGSSNGTFINGKKIQSHAPMSVASSSLVLIGTSYILKISLLEEEKRGDRIQSTKTNNAEEIFNKEVAIRKTIHEKLIQQLDLRRKDIASLSEADLREKAQRAVEQILIDIRWEIPEGLDREKLIKDVLNEALGLGPLEDLLADEDCSEVMVNSYCQIYAERKGKLELTPFRYSSEQAVLASIERIIAPIGRRIDESSPMVDARLKDGSRVNAVIRPLALNGPCITIRKFSKDPLVAADLVRFGSFSQGMSDFLKLAVENRLNIVISGGTGSGKTTLLNVISSFIPEGRVITIEDAAELRLAHRHVVSFETRPPNLEGKGAIAIRDLVRNALRMRPDRIIVGECRGPEALDMLQAMNTGHDGSMTTGHANTPIDMIRRLETMVLMAGLDLPLKAIREQISSAINLIVQQTRFACGTRKVTSISEVQGLDQDEGTVMLQDIFVFKQDGYDEDGKINGWHQATGYVPKFFRKLQERGLPVDASVFSVAK